MMDVFVRVILDVELLKSAAAATVIIGSDRLFGDVEFSKVSPNLIERGYNLI